MQTTLLDSNKTQNKDCLIITAHFGGQQYDYKFSADKENWNAKSYQDLYTAISDSFHCTSPIMFKDIDGNKFDIDDINDILNAFDENESNKSLHLFIEVASNGFNKYQMWFNNVLQLPQYYQTFIDGGYMDLDYMDENIDEQELIYDLKICNKLHRQKILKAIEELIRKKDTENITEQEFEDDQAFESDENNSWNDLELLLPNEQIDQSCISYISPNDEFQECWQCFECNTMNNVRLTIRKYHYKCCGCVDICYIPNQTPTTYECKWDTPTDYLLKQNKIWICNKCDSINTNMRSNNCEICEPNIKCDYCNRYISSLSFMIHEIHCIKIKNKNKIILWICPKCNGKEIKNECKCSVCGCNHPTQHSYLKIKLNGNLVFGFCRYYFAQFIPQVIKNIIIDFINMQTFSTKTKHLKDYKNVSFHYNLGFRTELFGDKYFMGNDFNVWKCKLTVDDKYVVKMEGDNEAAKIYDIAIGITFKINEFDKSTGKVKIIDQYYIIKGHGNPLSLSNFSHPMIRDGDIVIVQLDCKQCTLSYGINQNWYGIAYSHLPNNTKYRLYVDVQQRGVKIQLIN
eukprot:272855_1